MLFKELEKDNTRKFEEIFNKSKQDHQINMLKEIQELEYTTYTKSNEFKFNNIPKMSTKDRGVYLLKHKDKVMYVGSGVIPQRLRRHKHVFLNEGKDIEHEKSTSPSQVATKAYDYDNNIDNWNIECIRVIGNTTRSFLEKLENDIINEYKPEFNVMGKEE